MHTRQHAKWLHKIHFFYVSEKWIFVFSKVFLHFFMSKSWPTSTKIIPNWRTHSPGYLQLRSVTPARTVHRTGSPKLNVNMPKLYHLTNLHHQATIVINAGILLIRPLGTNFSEILIEIHNFSFQKIYLKMSSVKRWQFCLGLNVLNIRMQRK